MVTAALRSVFAQESTEEIESRWDDLAFRLFPKDHWRKIWSTNLLERVNEEIKCRRMFSAESMATIPELGDIPSLQALSA